MKKILSCLSCMLLLFSILTACSSDVETRELVWNENGYESLLQAEEFEKIQKLSGSILSETRTIIRSSNLDITVEKENIHFKLAYKSYMVNPLKLEDLEQELPRAEYAWNIPVLTDNGHFIVSCRLNRKLNTNSKGLLNDSSLRIIANQEVRWQTSLSYYYPNASKLPTEILDDALINTNFDQRVHKIFFGDCNKMRGLYSLVLQDKKPVYMVPIKDFSVSGIEKISGDMKSAGDFIDGQRYTYKDFAERINRVKEHKHVFPYGGEPGLITNPTRPKFLEGIKPEGIVLLIIVAAFLLTTGGILVYQKVKDRVR